MKIAFYNVTAGFKTGGLETFTWEMARACARLGAQVEIIGGEGGAARHSEVGFTAFAHTPRASFPKLGTRFGKLMERLSFAKAAWRYLLQQDYDAIVINKPYDFPAMWWLRKKKFGGVIAYNSGGTEFFKSDRFFSTAIDIWFPCSDYNARQIAAHYRCSPDVVYNGVDPQAFSPDTPTSGIRQRFSIAADTPLIVSSGRLIGWKGVHVVIDALQALPAAHYLIVGHGPEREALTSQAARLSISDRVHFAGELPHDQLASVLVECDIYVQPSVGEEAFGISVIEAMSCQLPVLASRQGGLVEVVADGETGLLLPPGDTLAWRSALAQLIDQPAARQRLGEAGRRRVLERFTWQSGASRLIGLIEQKAGRP